jgi:hypothetical protein
MRALTAAFAAALLLSTGARAAEVQVDEFTATAGTREFIPSNITIEAGREYRMVVSGTMTQSRNGNSSSLDAVYCFGTSQGNGCNPPSQSMALSVAFQVAAKQPTDFGGVQNFAEFGIEYKVPDYDDSHTYETVFRSQSGGKLWIVSPPFTEDGSTSTGSWRVRLLTEEAKPTPSGGGGTGNALLYTAPAPGGGLITSSPALAAGLRSLRAAISLTGAAASRTFAASALRITDGRKLLSVCAVWGDVGAPARQVHLTRRLATSDDERLAGLTACTRALQRRVGNPSGGCRLSLVPVLAPGTHLTSSQRRATARFVRRNLASSCSSSASGGLKLSLRAKTDQATMPALLGGRMALAVVRGRAAGADGPNPKLAIGWSA